MNRYDFIWFFDVKDANPNGDPDAGNLPRIDPETGHGLVTDVCQKRKVRNYVHTTRRENIEYQIFIREREPLNPKIAEACKETGLPDHSKVDGKWDKDKAKKRPRNEISKLQNWLCGHFYDIRTFGAVLSTGPNAGQLRGPVQLSFARSVDPIVTAEHTITRVADVDEEEGEMGRKFTVPYALYRAHGFVNPFLATQTGFGDDDLSLLWESLINAFQFDQSAARPAGSMATRRLLVFRHDNELGKAPSHKLFEAVSVRRKDGVDVLRDFSHYEVSVDRTAIPEGVELLEMSE